MKIMPTWTQQNGYPVVSIETLNASHIKISQTPFIKYLNHSQIFLK